MGGHIALTGTPLGGWFRENKTEFAGREIFGFLASVAGFDDRMTFAAGELAAVLAHEKTLDTVFDRCTNHGGSRPFWVEITRKLQTGKFKELMEKVKVKTLKSR